MINDKDIIKYYSDLGRNKIREVAKKYSYEDLKKLAAEEEPKKMTSEEIAQICHETNRVYCKMIGDNSQVAWDEAPQWQRFSAIVGVEFIINNEHAQASDSHESWFAQKKQDGWKYGAVKDAENKTHPCCVPYSKLPREQQIKDHLFLAIVKAIIGRK